MSEGSDRACMETMDTADSDDSSSKVCYKLRSEKTLSGEIKVVQWSPKMDLIAFALKDSSVSN